MELQRGRERDQIILHTAMDGFWVLDMDGRICEVNAAYCQMSGYSEQELLRMHLADIAEDPAGRSTPERLAQAKADGRSRFARLHRRKDGTLMQVEVSCQFLDVAGGRFISFLRDVTDQARAEAELRASEARYRELFEEMAEAFAGFDVVCDRSGRPIDLRFATVNPAFESQTSVPAERVIGKTIRELFGDADPLWIDEFCRVATTGEPARLEHRFGPRGQIYEAHAFRTRPLQIGVVFNNVTHVRSAEVARLKLEAELRQALKMEAVGRLAAGVAHDFNNMIGAIIGFASLALEDVDASHPVHSSLVSILGAAERSAALTKQLLTFARKQPVAPRFIDLNETVAAMMPVLTRLIGEHIAVRFVPAVAPAVVLADPAQVDHIVVNLAVNARDAISTVGSVTIEIDNCVFDDEFCAQHPEAKPGGYVRLRVRDDGCGMDQATQAQVFDPFFTTKPVGKGTGLGLSSVYGAVAQNEGVILLSSAVGLGTTVSVCLPRRAAVPERSDPRTVPSVPPGSATVLVVEDELTLLDVTARTLRRRGYRVLHASKPSEGLRLAREHASELRLLVTDVMMPEMNGRELATEVHRLCPSIRCLFVSGYTDTVKMEDFGFERVALLAKPFSPSDLARAVQRILSA